MPAAATDDTDLTQQHRGRAGQRLGEPARQDAGVDRPSDPRARRHMGEDGPAEHVAQLRRAE
jgi:hypothetical protein